MSLRRLALMLTAVIAGIGCPPSEPAPEPSLSLTARPLRINDRGEASTLTVTATLANGGPGTGTVSLTAPSGTVSPASVSLDAEGRGTATFSCDMNTQTGCAGRLAVDAAWMVAGTTLTATVRITVGDAGTAGGAGGGAGGTGGSTGGGTGGGDDDGGLGGGSTAGGSGGSFDAGARDSGVALQLDAGDMLLIGTFIEGSALYTLSTMLPDAGGPAVNDTVLMFPPNADRSGAVLRPQGPLVYFDDSATPLLLELSADLMQSTPDGGGYVTLLPADPGANDVIVPTPACAPSSRFWVRPDTGAVVYACGATEYFEGATALSAYSGLELLALGNQGVALGRVAGVDVVRDSTGNDTPITGLGGRNLGVYFNNVLGRQVRATATGFVLPFGQPTTAATPCQLWAISAAGAANSLGTFADLPAGVTMISPCEGKLDSSNTLWSLGRATTDAGQTDVVVTRTFGAANIHYAEPDAGPSQFDRYPPTLFTFIEPFESRLVTGP